jgi:hypothetical protein
MRGHLHLQWIIEALARLNLQATDRVVHGQEADWREAVT